MPTMQRADGSFPMKIVDGEAEDERGDVNMTAYVAVGLWHHWLVRRDLRFVQRYWPTVRAALDWVVAQQAFGGISYTPTEDYACSPAARASTSRCAPASRSPTWSTTRSPSGSSPAAGSATRCASTAICSRTSRRTRWTGTTRSSAAPSAARPAWRCSRPVGTTSSCPDSASTASTPTRG